MGQVSTPSLATSASGASTTESISAIEPLILTAQPPDLRVLIIHLNRPHVLNALSMALIEVLLSALRTADADPEIGAIVITGNDKVFAGTML